LISYGVAMEVFDVASALAILGEDVTISSYLDILGSAFTDSIFGSLVGIVFGLVSAIITKYTSVKCQSFEPIIVFGSALLGYLVCLNLGFNYIFYTIICALVQERYSFINMSPRSFMSTSNIICVAAILSAFVLFLLVGIEVAVTLENGEKSLDWYFVLASILTIYTMKTIVTFSFCFIVNCFIGIPIPLKWQALLVLGRQKGPLNLTMAVMYVGLNDCLFKQSILVIISISLIVFGIVSKYLIAHLGPKEVWKGDLMSQVFRYGLGEIDSLVGSEMMEDVGNCFKIVENKFFMWFIQENKRKTDVYRKHREEERMQALRTLERHDYPMPIATVMVASEDSAEIIPIVNLGASEDT